MGYDKISIIMGLLIKALDTNADQLVFTKIIAKHASTTNYSY